MVADGHMSEHALLKTKHLFNGCIFILIFGCIPFIVQANVDFNSCLSENGKLRETFDHMRLEKKTFDTIRLKLEKELVENKQKIMEGIETSTAAYEAR